MARGVFDTQFIDISSAIDRTYLANLALESGTTFQDMVRELDAAMGAFNSTNDALLGDLGFHTQQSFLEYRTSMEFELTEVREYTEARPQRGRGGGGHMLPVREYEVSMAWTERRLRDARPDDMVSEMEGALLGFRNSARRQFLSRLTSAAEIPVDPRRSTEVSPGFAGSGTGLRAYTQGFPDGTALPGGYTHYFRADSSTLETAIQTARDNMVLQGHVGPFDIIAPASMVTVLRGLSTFVQAGSPLIRSAPDAEEALVDPLAYIGVILDDVRIRRPIRDWSDPNFVLFKSYGDNDPRNPLAIRHPDAPNNYYGTNGRDIVLGSTEFFPLALAKVQGSWGIGVSDRTAAALFRVDTSGGYVAPAITGLNLNAY